MTVVNPTIESVLQQETVPYEETDDPNLKAHILNPPKNLHIWEPHMEIQDVVDIARVRGIPVVALCGHVFIPKYDPDKCEACEACMKVAGDIMRELGE